MKERNRFSMILEHLLTMANLKNYVLAKELQYDESYVSKWRSGKLLPTEKNYDLVLSGISKCIVDSLTEDNVDIFYNEYQIYNKEDLKEAIYDHLETEYNYVKDLKASTGSEIASKMSYYPEMPISQFITKMKHPSLRKVKELDVCAITDILRLDNSYQLMITDFNNMNLDRNIKFPGVHFSMFIDYTDVERKAVYTAIFFMNMLTNLSSIDFSLYGGKQAKDKLVFSVKDAYSISGMLIDKSHCISVVSSEDTEIANSLHKQIRSLCTRENLLIRRTNIYEMLHNFEYEHSLFSLNQRWLFGHPTEHFLPDDLHEELLNQHLKDAAPADLKKLRGIHHLTAKVITNNPIHILIHESAFDDFTVKGTIDFYGYKVKLTAAQRLRYITYLHELLTQKNSLEIKTVRGGTIDDFQHIPNPTLFLSDSYCYLCLDTITSQYNICVPNKVAINNIFLRFFDDFWEKTEPDEAQGTYSFVTRLLHMSRSIEIMSDTYV